MAQKTIVPFGEPILRKTAKPVTEFNERLWKLLDDMADTLYAAEGRAGLAAPQIGMLRRVIIMDCGDGLVELINPVITELEGEQMGHEACLSFVGFHGTVKRAERVKITSMDRNGQPFEMECEGFTARCIQHEIDHLNGILFIDHVKSGELYFDGSGKRADLLAALKLSNSSV